jgi:hypothetical protein
LFSRFLENLHEEKSSEPDKFPSLRLIMQ